MSRVQRWHGNIKCGCGHRQVDHYGGTGWCHHSKHKNRGKCGCTWFWPSDRYIAAQKKISPKLRKK